MDAEATTHAYEAEARSTDTFGRMLWMEIRARG